jgi:hypothetical protein
MPAPELEPLVPLSLDEFHVLVERAGLGAVPDDDLALMRHYWEGARPQIASLRQALALPDEPATTFQALPPRLT